MRLGPEGAEKPAIRLPGMPEDQYEEIAGAVLLLIAAGALAQPGTSDHLPG
jgi:hypothetical protein